MSFLTNFGIGALRQLNQGYDNERSLEYQKQLRAAEVIDNAAASYLSEMPKLVASETDKLRNFNNNVALYGRNKAEVIASMGGDPNSIKGYTISGDLPSGVDYAGDRQSQIQAYYDQAQKYTDMAMGGKSNKVLYGMAIPRPGSQMQKWMGGDFSVPKTQLPPMPAQTAQGEGPLPPMQTQMQPPLDASGMDSSNLSSSYNAGLSDSTTPPPVPQGPAATQTAQAMSAPQGAQPFSVEYNGPAQNPDLTGQNLEPIRNRIRQNVVATVQGTKGINIQVNPMTGSIEPIDAYSSGIISKLDNISNSMLDLVVAQLPPTASYQSVDYAAISDAVSDIYRTVYKKTEATTLSILSGMPVKKILNMNMHELEKLKGRDFQSGDTKITYDPTWTLAALRDLPIEAPNGTPSWKNIYGQ